MGKKDSCGFQVKIDHMQFANACQWPNQFWKTILNMKKKPQILVQNRILYSITSNNKLQAFLTLIEAGMSWRKVMMKKMMVHDSYNNIKQFLTFILEDLDVDMQVARCYNEEDPDVHMEEPKVMTKLEFKERLRTSGLPNITIQAQQGACTAKKVIDKIYKEVV